MDTRRVARALLIPLALGAGCTVFQHVDPAGATGERVRVRFATPRDVSVSERGGRDSVSFDGVEAVVGRVTRAATDTIWLSSVAIESGGRRMQQDPAATVRLTDVASGASVSELRVSGGRTVALLFTLAAVAAAVWLVRTVNANRD